MTRYGLVCLLFGALAWGQAANSTSTPAQKPGAAPAAAMPMQSAPAANAEPDLSKIPPDAAVITIQGMCEGADKKAATCKTVITREQFEKIVDAVQPQMSQRARRQFATRYTNALVMSDAAHDMGLDQGAEFQQRMNLARIQVLAQALQQAEQKKSTEISDKEIEDYYQKNQASFVEADLFRVYIPRTQQMQTPKDKLSDEEDKKRTDAAEATMKKESETLHQRALAGEDFDKLQAEAFKVSGIATKSPTSKMENVRADHLPPSQAAAMDLKVGEVSAILSDQSGYFIFKMAKKETLPLDKAHDEIKRTLSSQKMHDEMDAIEKASTTSLDDAYFGPEGPARPPMPMPRPH